MAAAVAALLVACVGSGSASTTRRPLSDVEYEPVGTIAIEWTGSPADGCAAAGVCGTKGAITLRTSAGLASGASNPQIVLERPAVARVSAPGASAGATRACASSEGILLVLDLPDSSASSRRATVNQAQSTEPPSAGACAGPTAGDLAALSLQVRPLARGGGWNLSGGDVFTAGPFAVAVHAHLRLFRRTAMLGALRRSEQLAQRVRSRGVHRRARSAYVFEETASETYRITGLSGSLGASFTGQAGTCGAVGTCGDAGSLELTPSPDGQTVTFTGERSVPRLVSEPSALGDLAAGRLITRNGFGGLRLGETLTGTLAPPEGPTCTSTVGQSAPVFRSDVSGDDDAIALVSAGEVDGFDFSDPLRSRCPGPTTPDVAPQHVLATGALSLSELTQPTLTVTLSQSQRGWSGDGYAGEFGGTLTFTLQRVGESGGTRRMRVDARRGRR